MGQRYKLISALIAITLVVLISVNIFCINKGSNYAEKMKSMLLKHNTIKVSDVFSFEFEKAFIFDDPYISGDGFAEKYGFDISIHQVDAGVTEGIQRIVFVDKDDSYVYEFKCNIENIKISELGMIIYPETPISLLSHEINNTMIVHFESSEYYNNQD